MTPPSSDASERSSQRALPPSTVLDPAPSDLASESRTTVDFRPRFCTCGCGNATPRQFIPGHNQRLRGDLTRSYQSARLVRVVLPLAEPIVVAAPAVAEALGPEWLAWVAPDVQMLQEFGDAAADAFMRDWEADQ